MNSEQSTVNSYFSRLTVHCSPFTVHCSLITDPSGVNRLPILTYHSLDDSGSPISTSPARFRWQMEYLQANGWRTLTLDALLAGHARGEWPARTFALTFDDGFKNFAERALPVLSACGFSATVFVVSDWVGRINHWPSQPAWVPRLALMNWTELHTIADAGMAIGGHSLSHSRLTQLTVQAAGREIVKCKREIEERLGHAVQAFAYPFGQTSAALEAIVAKNFRAGFGSRLAFATAASRATTFERIDIYYLRDARFFRALGDGWLDWYLSVRRWMRSLRRQ